MFCHNCGYNLKEESKFCSKCGIPVSNFITPDITKENKSDKNNVLEREHEKIKLDVEKFTQIQYYSPSFIKFFFLSIFTSGFYYMVWFFRNWESVKKLEKSDISTYIRAFFYIFTAMNLFPKILKSARSLRYKHTYPGVFLGLLFLSFGIFSKVADLIVSQNNYNLTETNFIFYLLITLLWIVTPLIFLPIIKAIEFNNRKIENYSEEENKLTTGQLVFVLLGLLLFLASLFL